MDCDRAQEFYSDYLERALDRPSAAALEAHLATCPPCREDVEALRATFAALDAVPEVEPPRDGVYRVIARLQDVRAEEVEAQRPAAPAFLHWLRSLSPARVALGTGLATLIVAGYMVVPGMGDHVRNTFFGTPGSVVVSPAPVERPSLTVNYTQSLTGGREPALQVLPKAEMTDARLQISSGGMNLNWNVPEKIGPDRPILVPLQNLIAQSGTLRVTLTSPLLGQEYHYLVALPSGTPVGTRVDLVIEPQPLGQALQRLTPFLDKPVIVDGVAEGTVQVGVEGGTVLGCLQEMVRPLGARVMTEDGAYRVVPAAP